METQIERGQPGQLAWQTDRLDSRLAVALIGNYEPDRQESMQRFAGVLARELPGHGIDVHLISPQPLIGRLMPSATGLGKWLGYIDKFVVFPFLLRWRLSRIARKPGASLVVHICDHSNSPYLPCIRNLPTLITCHDLLAIRGGLGDPTAYCPASQTGKILQRWILRCLYYASSFACDSTATRNDLAKLAPECAVRARVILISLNYRYSVIRDAESESRLRLIPQLKGPFILHVGSSQLRKNRDGVLRIFKRFRDQWDGLVVFAGEPLTNELRELGTALGVADRIVEVVKPGNDLLEALYNKALALLFPSRTEGFGWPIIEAQSCGCPVVCSRGEPFDEIGGDSVLQAGAESVEDFAILLSSLTNDAVRHDYVTKGLNNAQRFGIERMVSDYIALYNELGGC